MLKNIRRLEPINWQKLINETIKRRKEEGITQKEHAALAGVSIPTMIAFEKGQTSISVANALNIMTAMGTASLENKDDDKQKLDLFTENAEERWFELVSNLPQNSPARHEYGYYCYSYQIIGDIKKYDEEKFLEEMKKASKIKYSGWTPFHIFTRKEIKPYIFDDLLECWLAEEKVDGLLAIAANNTDFWHASKEGYFHLHSGFSEDSNPSLIACGKKFEINFHIVKTAEVILHAARLAKLVAKEPIKTQINLKVQFNGLQNRELISMDSRIYDQAICKQNIVQLKTIFNITDISDNLTEENYLNNLTKIIHKLLYELYSYFDFFKLTEELVKNRLEQIQKY